MSKPSNEQVLTLTDLKILRFLIKNKKAVKIGEINNHLDKFHQRTKDRIKKLEGVFIQESKEIHSRREKPYEIIPAEREFIEKILEKWRMLK